MRSAAECDSTDVYKRQRQHPCHGCDEREDHARWGERYFRLAGETRLLRERIEQRTQSVARAFDNVCNVLIELGYFTGTPPHLSSTPAGVSLGQLHTELDLLVAQVLDRGHLLKLTPAEFVSAVSLLVHESRRDADVARIPNPHVQAAVDDIQDAWLEITAVEAAYSIFRWASGARLSSVLRDGDISAGDFVRWVRRIIDLLEQIAAADIRHSDVARNGINLIRRGIVASIDIED